MATNDQNLIDLIKGGNVNLEDLKQAVGAQAQGSNLVTVSDWAACYSSATGQLSAYCTVMSNSGSNPITGVGLIVYNSAGTTMLCLQYTNQFNTTAVATSVGTNLYNTSQGNQVLSIVYGWTQGGNFYLSNTLNVGSC